jgi:hypothetical protein
MSITLPRLGIAAVFIGSLCHAQVVSGERKHYADDTRGIYSFPFGKGLISTPGNAAVEGNDFIQPGAFPSAEYCGKCHQEAYSQWR